MHGMNQYLIIAKHNFMVAILSINHLSTMHDYL